MRLHIHFGVHRTGTTSRYKSLAGSVRILKGHGALYPSLGVNCRHVRLAWRLKAGKLAAEEIVRKITNASNELMTQLVLSSEDFSLADIENWLSTLSRYFNVTASVYILRQDRWLESWYNQH